MLLKFDRILDRCLGGHITLWKVTLFGHNAMHWAVQVDTGRGYIVARPTTGRVLNGCGYRGWYLYVSPNATPGAAWWGIGPGFRQER